MEMITMRISRTRYYVFRDGGREVWCGSGKTLHFKPVAKLGDTQLKSYATEAMAERAMKLTDYEDYEIRARRESVR
jgi:hypothetical protein